MSNGKSTLGPFGKLLTQLMTDDTLLAQLSADPQALVAQYNINVAQVKLLISGDANAIEAEFEKENPFSAVGDPAFVRTKASAIKERFMRRKSKS